MRLKDIFLSSLNDIRVQCFPLASLVSRFVYTEVCDGMHFPSVGREQNIGQLALRHCDRQQIEGMSAGAVGF
jgi:hypothetical protein